MSDSGNTSVQIFQDFIENRHRREVMLQERNIKIYQAAYQYLEQIKPEGVRLQDDFYGYNQDYKSLKELCSEDSRV